MVGSFDRSRTFWRGPRVCLGFLFVFWNPLAGQVIGVQLDREYDSIRGLLLPTWVEEGPEELLVISDLAGGKVVVANGAGEPVSVLRGAEHRDAGFATASMAWLGRGGDTLYVVDPEARRMFLFGENGTLLGSFPLGVLPNERVDLPDGEVFVSGMSLSGRGQADPLHTTRDFSAWRSFGAEKERLSAAGRAMGSRRALALSGDSAVWVAFPNRYRIQKWDKDSLVFEREFHRSWFTPWRDRGEGQPLVPLLSDLFEDGQGLLWVVFSVPAGAGGLGADPDPTQDRSTDWLIEVLDPTQNFLPLASIRMPRPPGDQGAHFLADGRLWGAREFPTGQWVIQVFKVSLTLEQFLFPNDGMFEGDNARAP